MRWRVALGSWALAILLLVVLPLASASDPDLSDVPDLGSVPWWLGLGVVTLQSQLLAYRAVAPRRVLLAVSVGAPIGALVGVQTLVGATTVAVLVAAFVAVLDRPLSRLRSALAGSAALVALGQFLSQLDIGGPGGGSNAPGLAAAAGGSLAQGVATVGAAALAGALVRSRREVAASREREVVALRREQAALVEVVVARERTAMARELHDIAAHHLSGMAVMTGAIGRQIDTDPEGAKLAVREVRAQSREMLRDLRRLVVLLREDVEGSNGVALIGEESLSGVRGLVESAQRNGADVTLTVVEGAGGHPAASGVGPLAQLSAYRTVQEALANSARHAPGAPVAVTIEAHRDGSGSGKGTRRVVVSVRGGPARGEPEGPGSGFGLVGMRERADLTGSELTVGPTPDGGWLVELALPADHTVETSNTAEQEKTP